MNYVGDINTTQGYFQSYKALVKNREDMVLPCVLAIDKTQIDMYS